MKIKSAIISIGLLFLATVAKCGPNGAASVADNPLNHIDSGAELEQQREIQEQYSQEQARYSQEQARIASANQAAYEEQLASLNQLRQHLEDLQGANAGGFFRVVHGVTNYIYGGGWNYVGGKVLQTLPDGVLVKPTDPDATDVFVDGYPFQTVDDQVFTGCMAMEDGVYSFTAVSGGRRTVKKMSYGVTVTPSPELLEKEIDITKYEIQNHPLVLKAKADAVARQKSKEKNYQAQANAIHFLQPQATNGDASAQCELGLHFLNGQGCEINQEQGVYWLQKAAAHGDLRASKKLDQLKQQN